MIGSLRGRFYWRFPRIQIFRRPSAYSALAGLKMYPLCGPLPQILSANGVNEMRFKLRVKLSLTLLVACRVFVIMLWGHFMGFTPKVMASPQGATNCIILRPRSYGDGQELYNSCNTMLEVTWCLYSQNNCSRFNNTWTIGPGDSYPVGSGTVEWSACVGRDSIRNRGTKSVYCE